MLLLLLWKLIGYTKQGEKREYGLQRLLFYTFKATVSRAINMDPKDVSDEGEVEEMMWSIKATDFLVEASSEAVGNGEIASNRKCARADKQANMQQPLDELSDTDGKIGYAYDTKSVKEKNKKPGANTPCKTENKEGLIDNRVGVPDMLNVTPQVWQTLQEEATTCWRDCLENNRSDPVPYFRKLSETFRCGKCRYVLQLNELV